MTSHERLDKMVRDIIRIPVRYFPEEIRPTLRELREIIDMTDKTDLVDINEDDCIIIPSGNYTKAELIAKIIASKKEHVVVVRKEIPNHQTTKP